MVERVRELGVRDPRVLGALQRIERHRFVDPALASRAYEDTALPLGYGQTISQPYIVARCAELALAGAARAVAMQEGAHAAGGVRVLEVGTGCGYSAAILSELFGMVFSIERVRALHEMARGVLRPMRIASLRLVFGDGMLGLPSEAPFHAIVSTAAAEDVPAAWPAQLAAGGVIVAPLGRGVQTLTAISKGADGELVRTRYEPVRFVPLLPGTMTMDKR